MRYDDAKSTNTIFMSDDDEVDDVKFSHVYWNGKRDGYGNKNTKKKKRRPKEGRNELYMRRNQGRRRKMVKDL